ncbi:DgyrCDS7136 [Dimorphilus gyrociliatus]|uniref:DgyrCDS7136 n=1 Tax=Dimorphilus gyrociliatus TaxID=2664684 RepID=A0A7I8VST3_9ANNE|nr:DgyrCDS7136 [Dimorphilus gyrociliatus]
MDEENNPVFCRPGLTNIARGLIPNVTSQCGYRGSRESYCFMTTTTSRGSTRVRCFVCDDQRYSGDTLYTTLLPERMTDASDSTFWASATTYTDRTISRSPVNVTILFGKKMILANIKIKFRSTAPQSFVIERLTVDDKWEPYVIYSLTCERRYGMHDWELSDPIFTKDNFSAPYCTRQYVDFIGYEYGRAIFVPNINRFSGHTSTQEMMKNFVTVKGIRISLQEMITTPYANQDDLRRQFYSISNIHIGGSCYCSGHADTCTYYSERWMCECAHYTTGPNCEKCLEEYQDVPPMPGTPENVNACKRCQCNFHSERCIFNSTLYKATGSGSDCSLYCTSHTKGRNCELCEDNHYRDLDDPTLPCYQCRCDLLNTEKCDPVGGKCTCKEGATDEFCSSCLDGYYNTGSGCRKCTCNDEGTRFCDRGTCQCKAHVKGTDCDQCIKSFFGFSGNLTRGCLPCYCSDRTDICTVADNFYKNTIEANFKADNDGWKLEEFFMGQSLNTSEDYLEHDSGLVKPKRIEFTDGYEYFFIAPKKFLGDQRKSFYKFVTFTLVSESEVNPYNQDNDFILEGTDGLQIKKTLAKVPKVMGASYKIQLNRDGLEFTDDSSIAQVLSNLTAIKIRAAVPNRVIKYKLTHFALESADTSVGGDIDRMVENCTCPPEYTGLSCEKCAPGYYRSTPGPYGRCVKCDCHGHAIDCDPETGVCLDCKHDTTGDHCEKCKDAFYGNALQGGPNDCQPCKCKNTKKNLATCTVDKFQNVVCLNCLEGYSGLRCMECSIGYYGNPDLPATQGGGPCVKCKCNGNVHSNVINPCNRTSGECLECLESTMGSHCEDCAPGYFNMTYGQGCEACSCYFNGTKKPDNYTDELLTCDLKSGQCDCFDRVEGRRCDKCEQNFYGLDSGKGCTACLCNTTGTKTGQGQCNVKSGQCDCNKGVSGLRCDKCIENHWGFSYSGCEPCNCDPEGSLSEQCDLFTGECKCKPNYVSKTCSVCAENRYNKARGCLECDLCYSEVQSLVNTTRDNLMKVEQMIVDIRDNPKKLNDSDFAEKLEAVNASISALYEKALKQTGGGGMSMLAEKLSNDWKELEEKLKELMNGTQTIHQNLHITDKNLMEVRAKINDTQYNLDEVESKLNSSWALLHKTEELLNEHGQQNAELTIIAIKARDTADSIHKSAIQINKTANENFEKVEKLQQTITETFDKPDLLKDLIEELQINLTSVRSNYKNTLDLIESYKKIADDLRKAVIQISVNVDRDLGYKVNLTIYENMLNEINEQYEKIKELLENRKEKYEKDAEEMRPNVEKTKKQIYEIMELSKRFNLLLAQAYMEKKKISRAVEESGYAIKTAKETYKRLLDFDNVIQRSKKKSEEAEANSHQTKQWIKESNMKSIETGENIENADSVSSQAVETLRQGEKESENIDQTIKDVFKDLNESNETISKCSESMRDLVEGYEKTSIYVNNTQTINEDNKKTLDKVSGVTSQISTTTRDLEESIENSTKLIDEIKNIMDTLGDIDEERLKELEEKYTGLRTKFDESEIKSSIEEMTQVIKTSEQTLAEYEEQNIFFLKEIEALKKIQKVFPDKPKRVWSKE